MAKKAWQAPVLETLDVNNTMAGVGTKYIDYIFVDKDFDITDSADPGSVIVAPAPSLPDMS
ncbi:hypothetical protein FHS18_000584 [Paenibacillus phyllosphaerae]|uniref:Paeninodin family lasso peptide n=1 Tax=Paenibacillus phyllosphaerae TaxID=274593 RepID=A0A7W5AUK7_9BACL|nr:hypothetical protein [Paenibacillus phyllosphaerae]